ncbi:MAG: TonB-dependent receptor [Bacteroidetes bacterium]|nr:TonB-dependent receptor [Bacteroidota bacterium]MDA1120456.1 TonB-dependent receptor [Bacteroidota bacterium]
MNLHNLIPFLLSIALFPLQIQGQDKHTINGYIRDASNGESLIGATIYVQELESGAVTNFYGFYSITLEEGIYHIEFRYLGYNTESKTIELNNNERIDIELITEGQQLDEIIVLGEPEDDNVSSVQMSSNKLDIQSIQKLPSFLGEVDVLKSIQTLPGVSAVGEGTTGFNVRGGSVGQNLVLLDEAPVYNSSHLLGFFSVFNPDAVKDIQLIKGGIPARYGGRIASILDIRMKEGNSKEFSGQGGVGSIFSRLALEAPFKKDKASFIIAGRRSYADIFAKVFTDVLADGAALNFYDLTLKTNYNIDPKNRVFLSGYFGRDNFKFDAQQGFNWGNTTSTLRWNHLFNDRLFSNFTLFYSNYDYELAFGEDDLDKFTWNSEINTFNFKPEFNYFINPQNEVTFGADILFFNFEPANAVGVSNGEVRDISIDEKNALETGFYLSNDQKINNKISLQYGLRWSNFEFLGDSKYYEFDNPEPGTRRSVINTMESENFEVIQNYSNLEPRFAFKYQLTSNSSLKTSYNRTVQYIHLISNTTASNPLDIWIPSTNNVKPQMGHQVALGYFKNFGSENAYESSVEAYYRKTYNQIDYIDGADILINEFIEGDLLAGQGRAYGLEFYLKKNEGPLTGWLSYTIARTELQIDGINNGNWYPTRYDQAHNMKIASFYETPGRWSFSANFSFISGTPATFPTSRFEIQGYAIPYNQENSRNNLRIDSFHRLDISATLKGKQFRKDKKRKNEDYWIFSIYNVYGRRNPFSIYFSQADQRPFPGKVIETRATRVSIIGTLLPSISYNFKF